MAYADNLPLTICFRMMIQFGRQSQGLNVYEPCFASRFNIATQALKASGAFVASGWSGSDRRCGRWSQPSRKNIWGSPESPYFHYVRSTSLRACLRRKEKGPVLSVPSTYEAACAQGTRTCCLDVLGYSHSSPAGDWNLGTLTSPNRLSFCFTQPSQQRWLG
jgi:hypothetical protein